ncbi:MAG TPA: ankyrin repeat domain-containing protein [Pyrinomonadaceae bacterium]|nr:ankyrin repeat domain-containing protein [Pyrinomonadaceae bacterium]
MSVSTNSDLDSLFREAVSYIDAGQLSELQSLLAANPLLVTTRLEGAGDWLRGLVDGALEGYFKDPYLLWFVAENPIRHERLPANIAQITTAIIAAAKNEQAANLQEQLNYALGLVVTGRVPREAGVQLELMDVLIDAGARPGPGHGALSGRNLTAAAHLIERGGQLTLATAICLDRDAEVERLAVNATSRDKQIALVAAALNGKVEALSRLLELGVDLNAYSTGIHTHATALHHAVDSGSLDAVKVLVEAGARLDIRDKVYKGTPLDWAEYEGRQEIADYLRRR